uniref:sphingosine kinase n=1 Tax=Poecilia mexicana TaxID=48701 RepID=A0A3B3Y1W4_9TELE
NDPCGIIQHYTLRRPCRTMILVNPHSGRGQALQLFTGHIRAMLTEASVPYTLVITEHQNHARELVRNADLTQWDALVIMSGDGLLFEVINGLMEREDWQQAIQTPLGMLPGGSGNALAASIHHYSQSPPAWNEELLLSCGFMLCKGLVGPLDLVSVHLASSQRLFSFLSLAWGFVADVDIESEKYRHVGAIRFLMGTLATRPPFTPQQASPKPGTQGNNKTASPTDSLLPSLDQPVPENWTVVNEEDFVLVLAIYQSHLAEDLWTVPGAMADDGLIHLFYVTAGISRPALLRLFLAMERGSHLACGCPHLVYEKVRALRLEPVSQQGMITVDGEVVEYGPIQAQVHPRMARLICPQTPPPPRPGLTTLPALELCKKIEEI